MNFKHSFGIVGKHIEAESESAASVLERLHNVTEELALNPGAAN